MRRVNPPCERCGTETLVASDPSGGWLECPACSHLQAVHRTPPGEGRLSGRLGVCPGCVAAGLDECGPPPEAMSPVDDLSDDEIEAVIAEHMLNLLQAIVTNGIDPHRVLKLASKAIVDIDQLAAKDERRPQIASPLHDLGLHSIDELERALKGMRVRDPVRIEGYTLHEVLARQLEQMRLMVVNHYEHARSAASAPAKLILPGSPGWVN